MEKRDEYVEKMKAQLDQWNAEIVKWEARASQAQAEARAPVKGRDCAEVAVEMANLGRSIAKNHR